MFDSDLFEAYATARKKSAEWYARAGKDLAGKVGHDARYLEPVPLYMERGSGGRKWDVDGNEYIDFLLGNGALLLGHSPPEVVEALQQAVVSGTHFGNDPLPTLNFRGCRIDTGVARDSGRFTAHDGQDVGPRAGFGGTGAGNCCRTETGR